MKRHNAVRSYAFAVTLVLMESSGAFAAPDAFIPCKALLVKMDKTDPTVAGFKLVCKAPDEGFALPSGVNSPIANGLGAALTVVDLTSTLAIVPGLIMPSIGWEGLGLAPGADGFRYRDPASSFGCQSVTLDAGRLKVRCRTFMAAGTLPVAGDVGLLLTFHGDTSVSGQAYCAQFGGIDRRNDEKLLKRKDAPAPAACLEP